MSKYTCSICGYVYDELAGDPDAGISPGTKWVDVPDDWECPLCGASKSDFEAESPSEVAKSIFSNSANKDSVELEKLSYGEMSAIFSNLAKGCEKQYKMKDAELYKELAQYYEGISRASDKKKLSYIDELVQKDISSYSDGKAITSKNADRGALRALVWSEKVTKILSSILSRYNKQKDSLLKDKDLYVCEICGFVYLGDALPEVCPVCKVPNFKMGKVQKEAI